MTEHITPQRIANSILQKNTDSCHLIVEGKTDYRLFNKFVNNETCNVEIAFGNLRVIEVINELKKRDYQNVVGLIDTDFRLLDNEVEIEDVLSTDYHDIEITLINSPSFITVLSNYYQPHKLADLYDNDFSILRNYFFELSKNLGFLKWLNKSNNLGLIFKPLNPDGKSIDYNVFISVDDMKYLGDDKLVEAILNFCNGKVKVEIKKAELLKQLKDFKKEVDLNHLCNGHDIINIISISLRKHISNLNSKSIPPDQLEREFSLAYESRYFVSTKLYENLKAIEKSKNISILSI